MYIYINTGETQDIILLLECYLSSKQYKRAIGLFQCDEYNHLIKKKTYIRYIAAQCHVRSFVLSFPLCAYPLFATCRFCFFFYLLWYSSSKNSFLLLFYFFFLSSIFNSLLWMNGMMLRTFLVKILVSSISYTCL